MSWTWQLFSWFAVRVRKAEHHYNTNLYFGKLSRNSLRVLVGQLWNARQRGGCPEALARRPPSPFLGLNITRKWHDIKKNKKSKSVSVLHGCQGLKRLLLQLEDQHCGTPALAIPQRQGCRDESVPPLLFDPSIPWKMSFLLSAPQWCERQGPGRAPAAMLI